MHLMTQCPFMDEGMLSEVVDINRFVYSFICILCVNEVCLSYFVFLLFSSSFFCLLYSFVFLLFSSLFFCLLYSYQVLLHFLFVLIGLFWGHSQDYRSWIPSLYTILYLKQTNLLFILRELTQVYSPFRAFVLTVSQCSQLFLFS